MPKNGTSAIFFACRGQSTGKLLYDNSMTPLNRVPRLSALPQGTLSNVRLTAPDHPLLQSRRRPRDNAPALPINARPQISRYAQQRIELLAGKCFSAARRGTGATQGNKIMANFLKSFTRRICFQGRSLSPGTSALRERLPPRPRNPRTPPASLRRLPQHASAGRQHAHANRQRRYLLHRQRWHRLRQRRYCQKRHRNLYHQGRGRRRHIGHPQPHRLQSRPGCGSIPRPILPLSSSPPPASTPTVQLHSS